MLLDSMVNAFLPTKAKDIVGPVNTGFGRFVAKFLGQFPLS
jgi:hypothetical protein